MVSRRAKPRQTINIRNLSFWAICGYCFAVCFKDRLRKGLLDAEVGTHFLALFSISFKNTALLPAVPGLSCPGILSVIRKKHLQPNLRITSLCRAGENEIFTVFPVFLPSPESVSGRTLFRCPRGAACAQRRAARQRPARAKVPRR